MNKRGSTIIEAAVVMPLIILTIASLIAILSFLSNQVIVTTKVNVALTKFMGEETNTVTCDFKNNSVDIQKNGSLYMDIYYGRKTIGFKEMGILNKSFSKEIKGRVYEVKEKKIIRYADFFRGET